MSNRRKWLLYSAYTLGVGIFFVYTLFPSDVFKNYALYHLHRLNPDLSATIERISLALPIGIKAHQLTVALRNNRLIEPDEIDITPKIGSIWGSPACKVQAHAHEGRLDADVSTSEEAAESLTAFKGTITGMQLGDLPALKLFVRPNISGNLDGHFSGKLTGGMLDKMTADITITDCQVENTQAMLDLKQFTFRNADISLAIHSRNIQIKKCALKGNQLDGRISGNISLRKPFEESILDLRGSISPHPEFLASIQKTIPLKLFRKKRRSQTSIPIRLGGRINDPRFYFR